MAPNEAEMELLISLRRSRGCHSFGEPLSLCSMGLCPRLAIHTTNVKASPWRWAMQRCGRMSWLVARYLHNPDSVAHVAHIDHVANRRLPGHDTSDHCRIHAVLLANGVYHGLIPH